MKKLLLLTILLCSSLLCQAQKERIVLGDEQTSEYFPILKALPGAHPDRGQAGA